MAGYRSLSRTPGRSAWTGPTPGEGASSEAHCGQVVDRILVDRQQLIDDDVVTNRLDHAETRNVITVLDTLALDQAIGERDEDFAGLLRIPHKAARYRIGLDQLLALAGRE